MRDTEATAALAVMHDEILTTWSEALAAFMERSVANVRAFVEGAVDVPRLCRQLAYFYEPENYVDDFDRILPAREGAAAASALAERLSTELFGFDPAASRLRLYVTRGSKQWVPREKRKPGGTIGFASDGVHTDLGNYNGPFPVAELERALYLLAPLALAVRRESASTSH